MCLKIMPTYLALKARDTTDTDYNARPSKPRVIRRNGFRVESRASRGTSFQ